MSRLKRLAHSLLSGYILLGANVFYTLASLPLALRYLDVPEFALWGLTSNIAQYIALVDAGMAGTARILVDYKDQKDGGAYGSVIQTFVLVSIVQGALILVLGIGLAFGLVPVLRIPAAQEREFVLLTIGQCGLLMAGFLSRILNYLLGAHQRYDVVNYTQAATFAVSFGALWLGFRLRQGVYSTLWSQLAGWGVGVVGLGFWTLRLRLCPSRGCWGRPTWSRFRELFGYGRDVFLYAVGFQMLGASQTLVLTRGMGLEASAVWTACTRTYVLVNQVVFKIFDFAAPAFAEMIVRGERELLFRRFRSMVVSSASLGVLVGAVFAVCNQPFVRLWTGGKFGWSPINDALLAGALVLQAVTRCHLGLVGQAKQFHSMRYLYMFEGAFFLCLAQLVVPRGGITAMLAASVTATLLFSMPYGQWRSHRYFQVPWRTVAVQWWKSPLRLALGLAPLCGLAWWSGRLLPLRVQMLGSGAVVGLGGLALMLRWGVDEGLVDELMGRVPGWSRPLLSALRGRRAVPSEHALPPTRTLSR